MAQLMPLPLTVASLASVKSRLVLPFWYQLTHVVLDKGPSNGCVCVCVCVCATWDGESVELHPDDVRHRLGRSERGAELSTSEVVYVARHCAVVDHDLQTAGARRRRVDYTHTHIHSDAAYCYTRSVVCVYVDCTSTHSDAMASILGGK